eukprot:9092901-Pyramimonas_sp.AAC.1
MCRTAALEEGGVASSSSAAGDVGGARDGRSGSSHPGNPHNRGQSRKPQTRRQIIVVGGFLADAETAVMVAELRKISAFNPMFPAWMGPCKAQ